MTFEEIGKDRWEVASDAQAVHALLATSDAYAASRHDLPLPERSMASSERSVAAGAVHLLRRGGRPAAMFTLSEQVPQSAFDVDYPTANRPVYMRRLAVDPDALASDGLLGVHTLRRIVEVATAMGADAIRAETNPDLAGIVRLLQQFGFQQYGPVVTEGWMRRVNLQKQLEQRG